MKVIVQKVKSASCTVDDKITGQIEKGFMLLVGFTHTDTLENVKKMAKKIVGLRIFDDENGKMNLDLNSVGGKILSISQFTLYGDATKGNRPSFVNSMPGSSAEPLYNAFNELLRTEYNIEVETGIFGAHMYLNPICDGPVTIELEF
jgi:D-tyrosyl-tRNA(Tyr) deacylase